jgi:hypothetical protein
MSQRKLMNKVFNYPPIELKKVDSNDENQNQMEQFNVKDEALESNPECYYFFIILVTL